MPTTLTTTGVYERGVVIPRRKPKAPPQEVVVVYIGAMHQEAKKGRARRVHDAIEQRLAAGLKDIKEGRGIGPFSTVEESMKALLE